MTPSVWGRSLEARVHVLVTHDPGQPEQEWSWDLPYATSLPLLLSILEGYGPRVSSVTVDLRWGPLKPLRPF